MAFVTCSLESRGCAEGRLRRLLLSRPEVWVGGLGLFPRRQAEFSNPDDEHEKASQPSLCIPQPWLEGAEGLTSCLASWGTSVPMKVCQPRTLWLLQNFILGLTDVPLPSKVPEKKLVPGHTISGVVFFPIPRYVHSHTLFSP